MARHLKFHRLMARHLIAEAVENSKLEINGIGLLLFAGAGSSSMIVEQYISLKNAMDALAARNRLTLTSKNDALMIKVNMPHVADMDPWRLCSTL